MKKQSLLVLLLSVSSISVAATDNPACERKAQSIEKQIQHAKENGNDYRVKGLSIALSEVVTDCTDNKLIIEAENKIAEKHNKVNERLDELNKEKQKGNPEKILKKEKKLQEAQNELNEAKTELNSITELHN